MSKLQIYGHPVSQPSRSVVLLCETEKIDFEFKYIDLFGGEQKKPEYLKINPRGLVPSIIDGDFQLAESSTIMRYLANSRSSVAEHWYPKDPKARAQVDGFLDYVHTGLRKANLECAGTAIWSRLGKDTPLDKEAFKKATDKYIVELQYIESLLSQHKWVASNENPTLADFQLGAELEYAAFYKFDYAPYKKIQEFLTNIRALPHWNEVHEGLQKSVAYVLGLVKLE